MHFETKRAANYIQNVTKKSERTKNKAKSLNTLHGSHIFFQKLHQAANLEKTLCLFTSLIYIASKRGKPKRKNRVNFQHMQALHIYNI